MRKLFLTLSAILCLLISVIAQNRTITGKIVDENGQPISRASVLVKGTRIGTTTNSDGSFSLNVPADTRTLVVSYVGLSNNEITITNQSAYQISMSSAVSNMQEVVVSVAYGEQQKKAVVGSINTVTAEQIGKQQVVSAVSALQGLAPGVLIINGTGMPGDNPTIRIRGIGSYLASAEPLIVVDGIPFNGNINTINPNDIETINVLKDATATSLYGSRAANGVLLITTKKGRKGRDAAINVYSSYGIVSRAIEEYPYVTAEQYMRLAWEAQKNTAIAANIANPGAYATANLITGTNGLQYNPYNVANPIDANGNLVPGAQLLWETDYTKAVGTDNSIRKNVGVGIAGGSERLRYYFSGDYLQQNGYIVNSDYKRITARLNTEADLRDWFTIGLNMTVSNSNQNYPTQAGGASRNAVGYARSVASIYPLHQRDDAGNLILDANGNVQYDFGAQIAGRTINHNRPVSKNFNAIAVNELDKLLNDRLQTSMNAFGDIKLTKWLKFRSNIGVDRYNLSTLTYNNTTIGDAAPVKGRVTRGKALTNSYTWNNMLSFQKSFGSHNIGAMVSSEAYDFKQENISATRVGFPAPGIYEITAGATAEGSTSSTFRHRIESYLGRLTYNFNNKYFLEGTFRRDGSSRFTPEQRWGSFYSVGGSWLISAENFMTNIKPINFLKLRASYGEIGNEAILTGANQNYFPYLSEFSTGWNDLGNSGVVLTTVTNPAITWEKQGTYNIGLDFAILNNRISGSVEYFNKNTFDLLFPRPLQPSSGFTTVDENVGEMTNKGIEVVLNSKNISKANFSWETNFNFGTVKNEVTKLPPTQTKILANPFQIEVGRSLREFFIIEWAGVNAQTGEPQWYQDEVVAGVPTGKRILINTNSTATKYYFGSSLPKVTGGFSNTFKFKALDFSFLFNFALGAKILDGDYIGLMHGFGVNGGQLHTDILNRWQNPGDITDVPKLSYKNNIYGTPSTRHLFSGDYARLRNATLGFTLPKSIIDRQPVVKSLRIYVQADNYLTWVRDAKKGMDPEQGINGQTNASSSALKTLSFGLNVNF